MPDPSTLLFLVLIGAWAALDGTSVGQVMVSRPLVSATLAGSLLGDSATGLLVGIMLEGLYLGELPIGGARLPEPGPAGVPAAAAAVWIGGAGGLAIGIGIGVFWSLVGGLSVVSQRYLNGVIARPPFGGWRTASQLSGRHWACILMDGLRGAVVTGTGLGIVLAVPESVIARWPLTQPATAALLTMPAFLAGGALLRTWTDSRWRRLLLVIGCVLGLALALF